MADEAAEALQDVRYLETAKVNSRIALIVLLVLWVLPCIAALVRTGMHLVRGVRVQKVTLTVICGLLLGVLGIVLSLLMGQTSWVLDDADQSSCTTLAKSVAIVYVLTHFSRYQFLSQRMVGSVEVLRSNATPQRERFWYCLSEFVKLCSYAALIAAVAIGVYFQGRISRVVDGKVETTPFAFGNDRMAGIDELNEQENNTVAICVIVAPGLEVFASFFIYDAILSIIFTFLFAYPLWATAKKQQRMLDHPSQITSRADSISGNSFSDEAADEATQDILDAAQNQPVVLPVQHQPALNRLNSGESSEGYAVTWVSQVSAMHFEEAANLAIQNLRRVAKRHLIGAAVGLAATIFALLFYSAQVVRISTVPDIQPGQETLMLKRAHLMAFVDLSVNMAVIIFLTTAWVPKAKYVIEATNSFQPRQQSLKRSLEENPVSEL